MMDKQAIGGAQWCLARLLPGSLHMSFAVLGGERES